MAAIVLKTDCAGIDWKALNQRLAEDDFNNGRTPTQLRLSFENSRRVVFAMENGQVVGKGRAISDGVCNAYVVDLWTYSPFRKQGLGMRMLKALVEGLDGQHVALFTDSAPEFYVKAGFSRQGESFSAMSGTWLQNETRRLA